MINCKFESINNFFLVLCLNYEKKFRLNFGFNTLFRDEVKIQLKVQYLIATKSTRFNTFLIRINSTINNFPVISNFFKSITNFLKVGN